MSLPASFSSGRVMVVAFEGWNDAGDAASTVLNYFREHYHVDTITEFDAEDYFDYQFNRPYAKINEDGERELIWPSVSLTVVHDEDDRSMVLLQGTEPSRAWMSFCDEILDIALELDITGIIFLGALLADVPHTRPISIYTSSEDAQLRKSLDLSRSSYEGPVGILSVLAESAARRDVPSLTIWASVPHYVHNAPSPKATLALVQKLEDLLGIHLSKDDLIQEAESWEATVNVMSQDDEDLAHYIQQLEKARDTVDSPEASGDAIAEEFEKYLRLKDKDSDNPSGEGPRRGPEH